MAGGRRIRGFANSWQAEPAALLAGVQDRIEAANGLLTLTLRPGRLRHGRCRRRRRSLRGLRGPLHLSLDSFLERNLIRFERLAQHLVQRNARPLIGRNRTHLRDLRATSMRSSVIRLLKVAVPKANFLRSSSRICSCSLRVLTAVEYRARACRSAIA